MIITINTKEDSHDDIRRVIRMLQHLVGEHSTFTGQNVFENPSPSLDSAQPASAFGSMFGEASNVLSPADVKGKKEDEETPEVVVYDY